MGFTDRTWAWQDWTGVISTRKASCKNTDGGNKGMNGYKSALKYSENRKASSSLIQD